MSIVSAPPRPPVPGTAAPHPDLLRRGFAGVDCWIFDLDNTLYAPELQLFSQIEARMTAYVARLLSVDAAEASRLRAHYWREHGTTLAGLMALHRIDPEDYLAEVHDIDLNALAPDPALTAALSALPGRRIVHTNADSAYAGRVLARRQLVFDAIHGIGEVGYHPKPDPRSFAAVLDAHGLDPARCAMFEDDPRNLEVPHSLGMQTILVGDGRHGPDALAPGQDPGRHVHWRTPNLAGFVATLAAALAGVASSRPTL
ncbi:MAG TPA: pyrimidine 5'-nucleotidase [Paracoccus solventivorans]|uniref:pyrimidine 5'-nucleotidase n=1 Tax=Paracoccus solventivorans TaxID=53463 RepID=UPI002BAC9E61|nr:pyrimidine 5'-nucleotidase [Paracoccus solventivorans]HMM09656.1 pyrimidine 5'-nucleotidase [Paracoccus solventivorans]